MKNILVTGPARGLGLAISQRLSQEGYRVIGVGRKSSDDFDALMNSAEQDEVKFVEFDLLDIEGIAGLISEITHQHGSLYGLVNNSGVGLDGILATMHASDISQVLKLNLEAPITLTKYACRSMLKNGEGRIINISSIIASTGFNGLSVYAASKAGLEGFTGSLAREIGRAGITVNCVAPGFMETEMTSSLQGDKLESVRRRTPIDLPRTQDVAGTVSFLMSKDAERITGSTITVDGGSTA